MIGEASTTYCLTRTFPRTVSRIAEHLPDAKIVYSVRHPLKRMESTWLECLSNDTNEHQMMPRFFRQAVREYTPIIETIMYWQTISTYREYFSDDQILVLFFEDFKADPQAILAKCFRFLDVDPTFFVPHADRPRNVSTNRDMPGWVLWAFRQIPGWNVTNRVVPAQLRARLRERMRSPIAGRPKWDRRTRAWVIDQIADDTRAFLDYTGKPSDFWTYGMRFSSQFFAETVELLDGDCTIMLYLAQARKKYRKDQL